MSLIPSFDDVGKTTEQIERIVAFLKHSRRETLLVFAAMLLGAIGWWLRDATGSPVPFLLGDEIWLRWATFAGYAALGLGGLCFAWVVWRFWRRLGPPPPEPVQILATAIKGPLAFGPQDGDLFLRLGRQAELGELLTHILDDQVGLVVVRGESGAGKTSLLRAGLARVLQDQNPPIAYHYWEAVPEKSVERLLAAIRQSSKDPGNPPQLAELTDLQDPNALPGRHVVVLDQFEQLDRHDTAHRPIFDLFKYILTEASPPHHTAWIVAYRRDYDAEWRDFEEEDLRGNQQQERIVSVRLFREEQARKAMAIIAHAAGFELDSSIVDDLLAAMRNDQGLISPVDIAITLLALNEHAQSRPEKSIGKADLALGGGATGLLADYIERQLERYADDERSTIYAMLLELADLDTDRRRPEGLTLERLAEAVGRQPRQVEAYLRRLAAPNVRLLEALPTGTWRLPHERLIPALRSLSGRLLAEADQARRVLDRGYADWIAGNRSRRRLLRGAELRSVWQHRRQLALGRNDGDKQAFIQKSHRRRSRSRFAAGLAALAVAAISYWSFDTYRDEQVRQQLALWDLPRTLYDRQSELVSLSIVNDRLTHIDLLSGDLEHLTLMPPSLQDLQPLAGLDRLQSFTLNLENSDVADLQPLASLDGLQTLTLYLRGSSVADLQPLVGLDGLRTLTLFLSDNAPDLQPLAGLDGLQALTLNLGANVTDLQPLAGLDGLQALTLDLSGASVTGLQPLASLDGLQALTLDLRGSSVTDLQPLAGLNGLQALTLNLGANVTGLQQLASLDGLQTFTLNLSGASVADLQPLASLDGLQALTLDLGGSSVTDLQPLAGLDGLRTFTLDLRLSSVADLQPLASLDGLQTFTLNLSGSSVTDLQPLTSLDGLQALTLSVLASSVTDLQPLTSLDRLQALTLYLMGSSVADLQPLAGLDGLQTLSLDLEDSRFIDLQPVAQFLSMKTLSVAYRASNVPHDLPPNVRKLSLTLVR